MSQRLKKQINDIIDDLQGIRGILDSYKSSPATNAKIAKALGSAEWTICQLFGLDFGPLREGTAKPDKPAADAAK